MMIRIIFYIFITAVLSGCQSKYYSQDDFLTVLKIDSHAHINSNRGSFESQAGKDNFILITIEVDHSDSLAVKQQHDFSLFSEMNFPGRVFYSSTFFFDTTSWGSAKWKRKVIERLKDDLSGGAISVKLWKNIGMTVRDRNGRFIMVDDTAIKPVIDFIISRELPITGHLGEPLNCWLPLNRMTIRGDSSYFAQNPQYHMFLHPEYPSYEEQINARDRLLEMHPNLKFVGCHLGSLEWNVDELAKRLDKFPNMAVDMAARICHLQYQSSQDRDRVRDFCIRYQDRLLYGTDLSDDGTNSDEALTNWIHRTWLSDWKYLTSNKEMTSDDFKGKFVGLQLPKEVVDKIYRKNAIKYYKLPI